MIVSFPLLMCYPLLYYAPYKKSNAIKTRFYTINFSYIKEYQIKIIKIIVKIIAKNNSCKKRTYCSSYEEKTYYDLFNGFPLFYNLLPLNFEDHRLKYLHFQTTLLLHLPFLFHKNILLISTYCNSPFSHFPR